MLPFTRREFLSLSATAIAALVSTHGEADDILNHPRGAVETLERPRVLKAAERYLHEQPETIVSTPAPRSAGGLHDYFSEADYFWPDPENPDGPYINRDGESNPANFNAHRLLLIRLSIQAPALAAAWVLTKRPDFAAHAAAHLRAWFIEPSTRMNPNLQYAQAVHGVSTGRSYGIIDTLHLVEVAQAAVVLHNGGALSEPDWLGTRIWFTEYLGWMQTSEPGRKERDAKNNHGSCWLLQAAAFAMLTGDDSVVARMPRVVSKARSFPHRSRRMAASRLNSLAPSPMGIRSSTSMRLECVRTCCRPARTICGIMRSPTDGALQTAFTSWLRSSPRNDRGPTGTTFSTSTTFRCASRACSSPASRIANGSTSTFGRAWILVRLCRRSFATTLFGSPFCGSDKFRVQLAIEHPF